VNQNRVIISLYLVLFVGAGLTSGLFLWQASEEYSQLKRMEAASRQRLAEAEVRLKEQERILDRLRNDPAYVERVIRRRLFYAKPGEFVFRFED
jgi:cell division protein FtsB